MNFFGSYYLRPPKRPYLPPPEMRARRAVTTEDMAVTALNEGLERLAELGQTVVWICTARQPGFARLSR